MPTYILITYQYSEHLRFFSDFFAFFFFCCCFFCLNSNKLVKHAPIEKQIRQHWRFFTKKFFFEKNCRKKRPNVFHYYYCVVSVSGSSFDKLSKCMLAF